VFIPTGKFQQYDLGAKENQKVYNQSTPPEYDLAKITAPVYLFIADNDWLANTQVSR
jgi:lysosomal acid lipase/cholesteryl ester hydrolase